MVNQNSKAETKRREILRAAIECFAVRGLQKVSIQDISKASGMRSGHIYYYFKNKEEILQAAYNVGVEETLSKLEHLLESDDVLAATIEIHQWADNTRREWNVTPELRLEFELEMSRSPALRGVQKERFARTHRALENAAKRAIAEGRLTDAVTPAQFARALSVIWLGLGTLRAISDEDITLYEDTVRTLIGPLLNVPA